LQVRRRAGGLTQCTDVASALDQCAFVREYCGREHISLVNYLEIYYCTLSEVKPAALAILGLCVVVVFTTIGISASDFLCPNLNTIATMLGMSESLAGVTFLALGNGSPDVFSTYSAMKVGSGSLAVGELVGAASFITSVVSGSMAIICPFTVAWRVFMRDLCFFTLAIAFTMYVLEDGQIVRWEAAAMIAFYVAYVLFVVAWHWWTVTRRNAEIAKYQRIQQLRLEEHYALAAARAPTAPRAVGLAVPAPATTATVGSAPPALDARPTAVLDERSRPAGRARTRSLTGGESYGELTQTMRLHKAPATGESSQSPTLGSTPIRPSLFGALELRSAVERGRRARAGSEAGSGEQSPARPGRASQSPPKKSRHVRQRSRRLDHEMPDLVAAPSPRRGRSAADEAGRDAVPAVAVADDRPGSPVRRGSRPDIRVQTNMSGAGPVLVSPSSSSFVENTILRTAGAPVPRLLVSDTDTPEQASPMPRRPDLSLLRSSSAERAAFTASAMSATSSSTRASSRQRSPHSMRSLSPSRSPSPHDRFLVFQPHAAQHNELFHAGRQRVDDLEACSDLLQLPPSPHAKPFTGDYGGRIADEDLMLDEPESAGSDRERLLDRVDSRTSSEEPPPQYICGVAVSDDLYKTLFPTLVDLGDKTALNKFISVVAVPSVLLLTLTVPVIEVDATLAGDEQPEPASPGDAPPAESEMVFRGWNRRLVAAQCVIAPVAILLSKNFSLPDKSLLGLETLYVTVAGLALVGIITFYTRADEPPRFLPAVLCCIGFLVSMVWISFLADEVVGVMKAVGVIFDISEAILGLTVFALGNSLGDFVSNVTVAKMGYPMMAISACFGGPMLNILLGIGISGLATIPAGRNGDAGYSITISPSLVISGAALLANLVLFLVCVPWSGWRMTRRLGMVSVAIWVVSTTVNVTREAIDMYA
ncbi:Sodium/calcium exchanger protein-domain-containing protein, partial [Dipodascopsis tothii]|uniref:Sodium/calcium exchanger protein-domain-containing protein n=1 Tax=Dipodascopsis tothii TaxID=44089 RepID=UPI0034CE89D3